MLLCESGMSSGERLGELGGVCCGGIMRVVDHTHLINKIVKRDRRRRKEKSFDDCLLLALLRFDATTNNDSLIASLPPNHKVKQTGLRFKSRPKAVLCPDFQELLQSATFLIWPSHIRSTTQRAFSRHFHAHLPPRTAPKAQQIVHRQKFEAGRACLGGMRRGLSAASFQYITLNPD
jgi:hypothetical protein